MRPPADGASDLYVNGMAGGALIGSRRRARWPGSAPAPWRAAGTGDGGQI